MKPQRVAAAKVHPLLLPFSFKKKATQQQRSVKVLPFKAIYVV